MKKVIITGIVAILFCAALAEKGFMASAETYSYDNLGRVTKVVYEDESYDVYTYDVNGNIKSIRHYATSGSSGNTETTGEESGKETSETTTQSTAETSGTTSESATETSGTTSESATETSGTTSESATETSETTSESVSETSGTIANSASETASTSAQSQEDEGFLKSVQKTVQNFFHKPLPKKGEVYKKGKFRYKITKSSKKNGTVALVGVTTTKKKSYTIPKKVSINGYSFKITGISKNAFSKCKRCKKIKIKTKDLKSIHKTALKGIQKNAVIVVPKKNYKKYLKWLKKTSNYKILKVKKSIF